MSAFKKSVKAIHITDLEAILEKYGKVAAFRRGAMKCIVCADTVTSENAGSLKFTKGEPWLVCNKVSCYGEVVKVLMG